jgi:hypothetical protein
MRTYQVVNAAELAGAYASAVYSVALDGDTVALRVGQPATDLEAYWPARSYVFLTAWNPASEPHSDSANRTADGLLVAEFDAAGLPRLAACAQSADGQWREPGWLLADADDHVVDRLAHEFGQAGVLSWRCGGPVRLKMMVPCPDSTELAGPAARYIDWADDAATP